MNKLMIVADVAGMILFLGMGYLCLQYDSASPVIGKEKMLGLALALILADIGLVFGKFALSGIIAMVHQFFWKGGISWQPR